MSPAGQPHKEQRAVLLPLPVWVLWTALTTVYRLSVAGIRRINRYLESDSTWTAGGPTRHEDRDCRYLACELYRRLNGYREAQGLPPLGWSKRLEHSSLLQSSRMSETGEFGHELSDGVTLTDRIDRFGYRYQQCAENLAWLHAPHKSLREVARDIHQGWVDSPGHHANLVSSNTEVGIGVVPDGEGGHYATQNFGVPA